MFKNVIKVTSKFDGVVTMKTRATNKYARKYRKYTSLNENLRKDIEKYAPYVNYNGGYEDYEDSHNYLRIKAVLPL